MDVRNVGGSARKLLAANALGELLPMGLVDGSASAMPRGTSAWASSSCTRKSTGTIRLCVLSLGIQRSEFHMIVPAVFQSQVLRGIGLQVLLCQHILRKA